MWGSERDTKGSYGFVELTWEDVIIDRPVHVFQYALALGGSDVLTHETLWQQKGSGHFSLRDPVRFSGKTSEEETGLFFLTKFIVRLDQIWSTNHHTSSQPIISGNTWQMSDDVVETMGMKICRMCYDV